MPYNKDEATGRLESIGWRPYPRKHGESRFTVFYQEYILPRRFRIDKRRAHYASLILTDQMGREDALRLLEEPMFDSIQLAIERDFFCRKLQITDAELEAYMTQPYREHASMPNLTGKVEVARRALSWVGR